MGLEYSMGNSQYLCLFYKFHLHILSCLISIYEQVSIPLSSTHIYHPHRELQITHL